MTKEIYSNDDDDDDDDNNNNNNNNNNSLRVSLPLGQWTLLLKKTS